MSRHPALLAALLLAGLAACGRDAAVTQLPPPQEPTADSVAHFCGMQLLEHPGPKGQAIVVGQAQPIWFASARDALAYTRLPGEAQPIRALYVNDMARVRDWNHPEPGTWVDAHKALYVIGSDAKAGMGTTEAVPFSDRSAAQAFVTAHGGTIYRFDAVPTGYLLGNGATEADHAAN